MKKTLFKRFLTVAMAGILTISSTPVFHAEAKNPATGFYRNDRSGKIFCTKNGKPAERWQNDGTGNFFFRKGKKFTGKIIEKKSGKNVTRHFKNGRYAKGLQTFDGKTRFYVPKGRLANWWYDDGTGWYFFRNGLKWTGNARDNAGNHYFVNGRYATGYRKVNGETLFYNPDGCPANWWYDDGKDWYFFKKGRKFSGDAKDNAGKHYFVNGKYASGKHKRNGKTVVYDKNGRPINGWHRSGKSWLFYRNGAVFTGRAKDMGEMQTFLNGRYKDRPDLQPPFFTNSPLVDYTCLSPNHSGYRTHLIDRITPHCVVGQLQVENICACFMTAREASSNYCIGTDGRIGMSVEEKNHSWCSSSFSNDRRAVTIECASDYYHPYRMNSMVYRRLIQLCTDICKRNGKTKLLWFNDREKSLNYQAKPDEMVLTVHRWFAPTICPGQWLMNHMSDLATKVTANLQRDLKKNGTKAKTSATKKRKTSAKKAVEKSGKKTPARTVKKK